jgi:hypothetical protein
MVQRSDLEKVKWKRRLRSTAPIPPGEVVEAAFAVRVLGPGLVPLFERGG